MGESLFKRLDGGAEIARAVSDAEAWGFPRSVQPREVAEADWFRLGPSVVFWFEHYAEVPIYFVHIAVEPEARKRWPVRPWLRFIEQYARDAGADALGFVRCEGSEQSDDYLRRLNWGETEYGRVKPLEAA